jgi:hypothetical protein
MIFITHNNNAPETKVKKYELHTASTGKKATIEVKNITSADPIPFFLEIKYGSPMRRYPNMHLIAISITWMEYPLLKNMELLFWAIWLILTNKFPKKTFTRANDIASSIICTFLKQINLLHDNAIGTTKTSTIT